MKKLMAAVAAMTLAVPAMAEPEITRWNTHHSMGCMLVGDCTTGVIKVSNVEQLKEQLPDLTFGPDREEELDDLITEMNRIGIGVFVADEKYFVPRTRGIYHTVENNFFLNRKYMTDANTVLNTTRHEGWHAAQDCMAGTIDNSSIAIIHNEENVPQGYHIRAEILYGTLMPGAVPWEREAMWAMETPSMTANALRACQAEGGAMWDVYPPTPMTGEWLVENGYWDGVQR